MAVRAGRGDVLVGPDNGLLSMALERLGGVEAAVELRDPAYRLPVVSASFHGRDIFAPAAAHLALGVPLERLGPSLDPATLVRLPIPEPVVGPGALTAHVLYVDTFGNVKLTALAPYLPAALGPLAPGDPLILELGDGDGDGDGDGGARRTVPVTWRRTFGDAAVGEPLLYEDSYGRLCLAVNQGDAAGRHGIAEDLAATIRRP